LASIPFGGWGTCCWNDICKHFVCKCVHNEVAWMGDLAQLPLEGNFVPTIPICTIVCKYCGVSPILCAKL
jgi:hypothetical protein